MNGFERRKQMKMNGIKDTAFELFTRFGFQKVSIQDIAKKANVSQVTIYNYFGSKDDLLLHVLESYMNEKLQEFLEIKESSLPYREKIETMIKNKLESTESFSPEFLQSLLVEEGPVAELLQDFAMNKSIPLLYEFLAEGKQNGEISETLSLDTLILLMNTVLESVRKNVQLFDTEEKKQQYIKEIHHFFFYGFFGKA